MFMDIFRFSFFYYYSHKKHMNLRNEFVFVRPAILNDLDHYGLHFDVSLDCLYLHSMSQLSKESKLSVLIFSQT